MSSPFSSFFGRHHKISSAVFTALSSPRYDKILRQNVSGQGKEAAVVQKWLAGQYQAPPPHELVLQTRNKLCAGCAGYVLQRAKVYGVSGGDNAVHLAAACKQFLGARLIRQIRL